VIVMLLAIAAFDIGAVATMRRYLLEQTDQNLQVTLAIPRRRYPGALAAGFRPRPGDRRGDRRRPRRRRPECSPYVGATAWFVTAVFYWERAQ
jgi:hypothetical protein